MAETKLSKKKNTKILNKKQLKYIKYGCMLIKEIDTINIFQIGGDITIDINQILNGDHINAISTMNEFIKVKKVNLCNQSKFLEIYLDGDVYMRNDLSLPLKLLKDSHQKELFHLADVMEQYQQILYKKQFEDNKQSSEQQTQEIIIKMENNLNEPECDEFHGWNFEKSTEKAEKVMNDINQSLNNQEHFYAFILFKGEKNDQIKQRICYSTYVLRDFVCLNDEQISYIALRKPIVSIYKYKHQYVDYLFNRINCQIRLLKQGKSDLDCFRKGLTFLGQETVDYISIDNLSVKVNQVQYLYVLSNYKYKMDDTLLLIKWLPIANQSASQVLQGMRDLKKYLNEQQNQQLNPLLNGSIYNDQKYLKQSQLFREKYYSIIDNYMYHDFQEFL
ncbi:hypothetical protein TTHERM_00753440 (macronuclear) [Tetrahymena thermophila SB210]|uniref:Uncharacterized protein n=1 Tax=Tetrahymena thermophila (strain SB210) TaxID=312017 RepID=Q23NH6_TETTS|nr:hypothetical protein TTHERM_00753440 [Tetrahymena thermophila SB210]EAR98098.2 hypothetical protein TTHERM_00753440 [Tetrahymena thermophila SB210]|eukprot:XP_001018343.2 hypothetical protein TTHERM_00753440 [Tetrahymena thermophila SB210]